MNDVSICLIQKKLMALQGRGVAATAQPNIVGAQRFADHRITKVGFDDAAFFFGQSVRAIPQCVVTQHVDFLKHPVIGTIGQAFLSKPLVLEGPKPIDASFAVNDVFVRSIHTPSNVGCSRPT